MNNPLISVIIPVYKVEKYLRRCVDSVLNQTYTNILVVLVDDGSTDHCPEICDKYAQKDSRVRVIHKQNGGLSSARNAALDSTYLGDCLFFLDSDDYLHAKALELMVGIMERENADMVQCGYIRGADDVFPQIDVRVKYHVYDNTSIFYSNEQKLCLCMGLYKTALWKGIRMPIGKVNEDDATSWKLYFRSNKIAITPLPLYYYYVNGGSIMANLRKVYRLDFIDHYHNRIAFFRERGLTLHTQLSQWRFCLPLMIGGVSSKAATKEQREIMWREYKENVGDVLRCPKVPFGHKCLFVLYRCLPKTCRFAFSIIGFRKA